MVRDTTPSSAIGAVHIADGRNTAVDNGGILVGIFFGLLLLSWEIMGVLAKGPEIDTISQGVWYVRNWIKEHTGAAGLLVFIAGIFGFLAWLFWHFVFGDCKAC